jgi:acyltransferase
MSEQRFVWADWARALGIFLVILGHFPLQNNSVMVFIFSFHMPLFFILSGYFEKGNDSLRKSLARNSRVLLVPYLFLYLTSYLWWLIAVYPRHPERYLQGSAEGWLLKPLLGCLLGNGVDTRISYAVNVPLWFLVSLFWVRILFAVGMRVSRGNPRRAIALLALPLTAGLAIGLTGVHPPFSIGGAIMALPFYLLGYLLKKIGYPRPATIRGPWIHMVSFVSLGALTAWLSGLNGIVDMRSYYFGNSPALFYVAGIAGSFATFSLCRLLDSFRVRGIEFISANTLVILGLHEICISIALKIYGVVLNGKPDSLGTGAALWTSVIVLAMCIPGILIIRKYFPFILGKRIHRSIELA